MANGEIEVAPLAFMRGRTLAHAYAILDEAQNTTPVQMKMWLTRMGEGTRMVVTGDLTQVDLPAGMRSGLRDALDTLEGIRASAWSGSARATWCAIRWSRASSMRMISAPRRKATSGARRAVAATSEGDRQIGDGPGRK